MLRTLRGKSGQGISAEYVLLLFIVVGALAAMTTYMRRAYQGRVRDVNRLMMKSASNAYGTNIAMYYEPYYAESRSQTGQRSGKMERVDRTRQQTDTNDFIKSDGTSLQHPPHNAMEW